MVPVIQSDLRGNRLDCHARRRRMHRMLSRRTACIHRALSLHVIAASARSLDILVVSWTFLIRLTRLFAVAHIAAGKRGRGTFASQKQDYDCQNS